jgi:hypothetical protein
MSLLLTSTCSRYTPGDPDRVAVGGGINSGLNGRIVPGNPQRAGQRRSRQAQRETQEQARRTRAPGEAHHDLLLVVAVRCALRSGCGARALDISTTPPDYTRHRLKQRQSYQRRQGDKKSTVLLLIVSIRRYARSRRIPRAACSSTTPDHRRFLATFPRDYLPAPPDRQIVE